MLVWVSMPKRLICITSFLLLLLAPIIETILSKPNQLLSIMKYSKKLSGKLSLKKKTIQVLSADQQRSIAGGAQRTYSATCGFTGSIVICPDPTEPVLPGKPTDAGNLTEYCR